MSPGRRIEIRHTADHGPYGGCRLDGTFALLDKIYEERSTGLIFMNEHARYDRLRGDPRWRELMRKIGFTEAQIDAANARARERG